VTDTEDRLREALARERKPEPGAFFAARVANRVLAEDRLRRGRRKAPWPLRVLGFLVLCAAIVFVTGTSRGFGNELRILALVPAGFGLWTFRREIGREVRGAIELLLG